MAERDRIVDQMKRAFEEDAWHGPAVKEVLEGITWKKAIAKPIPAAHSIFEIVLHMAAWEDIVRRRLLGESVSPTSEEDWPPVTDPNNAGWDRALKALEAGNLRLRKTAAGIDDKVLDSPPVGKASTRYILLHGIIQHSLYHAGQIAVLKKG
jgi:uncharacterized damage-inducible protein DinB